MRDNPRTTVVSAVAGVVLLGGVFSFAVLVPKLDESPVSVSGESAESAESGGSSGPVELPDDLAGGLVAADLGTLPVQVAQQLPTPEDLQEQEAAISKGLDDVFGVPGTFRVYANEEGSARAQVTVLDRAPGLFTPDALPIDPSVLGVTRAPSELVRVGDAVCSVSWGAEVPAGQEPDPSAQPQGYRCQLGDGDRTYELTVQGLPLDDGITILEDLASA